MCQPGSKLVEDNRFYSISLIMDGKALLFSWKTAPDATNDDYMNAIRKIAKYSQETKPYLILIDKRKLESKVRFDHHWWHSEILPQYHKAGFAGFAHITGNPSANGTFAGAPEGLEFKMGEFKDIKSALAWKP